MPRFKITFYGEDANITTKSKAVNEPKLKYFLGILEQYENTETIKNRIRIYRGALKIKDISLNRDAFSEAFNKWFDYKQGK